MLIYDICFIFLISLDMTNSRPIRITINDPVSFLLIVLADFFPQKNCISYTLWEVSDFIKDMLGIYLYLQMTSSALLDLVLMRVSKGEMTCSRSCRR